MYHEWSSDFDFDSLDAAANYLSYNCRKWGRVGIWTKEKYGTLRVSTTCAFALEYDFLHSLLWPGHARIHWPEWVRTYIDWPIGKILKWLGIIKLFNKYQMFILKYFWKRAAKKWSHIAEEILDEYEWTFEEKL